MTADYFEKVYEHYCNIWQNVAGIYLWDKGPFEKLPHSFRVLEFAPNGKRDMWTYATCGMSDFENNNAIELHIFSSKQDSGIIELLTAVAYYHRNTCLIDIWHTVNFGKSWQDQSLCKYGLVSLPYLDGPKLELLTFDSVIIKFYWLIPITENEVNYKIKYDVEALEREFEMKQFNYIDPKRKSVV